jgi:H+-transporting ATPase
VTILGQPIGYRLKKDRSNFRLRVWGYALAWFLVNDRVKLLAYRIVDPVEDPSLAEKSLDLTPQIAARAYELYQERGQVESREF